MKRFMPELWWWMGLIAMTWAVFHPAEPHFDIEFLGGLGALLRGDLLAIKGEIEEWRRL